MGLGAYPASGKNWLGMLGMHGTYEANLAMYNCDVMINIGARFDDRITGKLAEFGAKASSRPVTRSSKRAPMQTIRSAWFIAQLAS